MGATLAQSAPPERRYALLLDEPPVVEQMRSVSLKGNAAAASVDVRARVADSQHRVVAALAGRNYKITASDGTLVNAVFVRAPEGAEKELAALPGVQRVVKLRPYKRLLNEAINLVNGPAAWNLAGGDQNAGLGMRIGIIDTGIDPNHPGMNDPSLPPPSGGKRCSGSDCDYTNNKIIAARSYVFTLDRPDDFTPRDRVGHGTAAAMVAAGVRNVAPAGTIEGVAPSAYLGNYKVFGSPGVNDSTYADVLTTALTDAFNDGMDVVTLSLGFPAEWRPTDATCGSAGNSPCDPFAYALNNAVISGMAVVIAAGNDGERGLFAPAYATINSPGTVRGAITVGSITNTHALYYGVKVTGSGVPSNLQRINATVGDGPRATGPVTGPMRDVSKLGNDGTACTALGHGSLNGAIAVLQTGNCLFSSKANTAQAAGAIGVVMINADSNALFPPTGLLQTAIPLMLIGKDDGAALLAFLASNTDRPGTLDPTLVAVSTEPYIVSTFSSLGPSIVNASLKPELVAPGENIYTATQKYDPNGDMYDPSGYTAISGSSFAAPFVAGAVALAKQSHPTWSVAQLKSAVVNTANPDVGDTHNPSLFARAIAMGAGRLDVAAAVSTNLTVEPSVISWGVASALPLSQGLTFRNSSNQMLSLTLSGQRTDPDNNTQITIRRASFTLQPGATSDIVSVQLQGSAPAPGRYEGVINVTGGSVPLRIPFLYVVGDGVPNNALPLANYDFDAQAGAQFSSLSLKVIDRYGVPVPNVDVLWSGYSGGGTVEGQQTSGPTDSFGISEATTILMGPAPGLQIFRATLNNTGLDPLDFYGNARLPLINNGGIVSAANGQGGPQAPGSYVSLYGSGLADSYAVFRTPYLPVSLSGVSVGFAVGNTVWAPGKIHFVSSGQVNVEVPWELAGQTSATVWLTIAGVSSNNQTIQLQNATPAGFVYTETSSGRLLAAALDANYNLIGTGNPAARGQYILLYANALGPLDHTPATGEPAPGTEPLARLQNPGQLSVTIGSRPAPPVYFAGLAPGIVGLYQVNVQVPQDAPSGYQPVILTVAGVASQPFTLPVQ